jgi:low affinity Fe/Cu permease
LRKKGKIVGISPQARSRRNGRKQTMAGSVVLLMRQLLTQMGEFAARPIAFLIVGAYAIIWFLFGRETLEWHGVASIATLLMTLFIQRAEHRDTQALQAKLDELLRVHDRARTELTRLDQLQPEEIERKRAVDSASD